MLFQSMNRYVENKEKYVKKVSSNRLSFSDLVVHCNSLKGFEIYRCMSFTFRNSDLIDLDWLSLLVISAAYDDYY